MIRGYVEGPAGQLHWRRANPDRASNAPDLWCFHPAPFSGAAFATIAPAMASGRTVFAPDYPGYGGSDPLAGEPSIEGYATAMATAIETLSPAHPVDLLGFHTGCLVALELALQRPSLIRRIVLLDVPYFEPEARATMLQSFPSPWPITPDLACLASAWDRGVTKRLSSQPLDRCFELFVEQLRPGAAINAAFQAAFRYPCETRFAAARHVRGTVLATQSPLLEASRAAARLLPWFTFRERLDIRRAVLDEAAGVTASEVLSVLS